MIQSSYEYNDNIIVDSFPSATKIFSVETQDGTYMIKINNVLNNTSLDLDSEQNNSQKLDFTINNTFSMIENYRKYKILDEEWVKMLYSEGKDVNEPDNLSLYFDKLDDLLYDKLYDEYDTVMQYLDIENTNETIIIGLLRFGYMYKNALNEWDNFLNHAQQEIIKRGHNHQELLHGLV